MLMASCRERPCSPAPAGRGQPGSAEEVQVGREVMKRGAGRERGEVLQSSAA